MFTGTLGNNVYEYAVAMDAEGFFYTEDQSTAQFPQNAGAFLVDITDHACLAGQTAPFHLYQWIDWQGWQDLGSAQTAAGTTISHIAYANGPSIIDPTDNPGPSQLYGLDINGHIFYANSPGGPQRRPSDQ